MSSSGDNQNKSTGLKIPSKIVRPTLIQKPTSPSTSTTTAGASSNVIEEIGFKVGDRVIVNGSKSGCIAYIGEAKFKEGEWAGVILDTADGKNNGTVDGFQYFHSEENRGIFCRLNKLELDTSSVTPSVTVVAEQPLTNETGLIVGDRVIVNSSNGAKKGYLRYLGVTEFAKGEWAGVELDEKIGKNDGSVNEKRYFQCEALFGVFAPITKVEKLIEKTKLPPPTATPLSKLSLLKPKVGLATTLKKNLSGSQESINSMKSEQSNLSISASQKSTTLKRPSTMLTKSKLALTSANQVVSSSLKVK
jgi:CAP-Gly domain-containing linker protein 1